MKGLINRDEVDFSQSHGTVFLDYIRDNLQLKGTKEGCREGECGSCAVLLGELKGGKMTYKAVSSCLLPLGELPGHHIVTIEGLNSQGLNPIQKAILEEGASQCGFCTPGIVISLTGFFINSKTLCLEDALDALDGNICRCTGYASIVRAIEKLVQKYSSLMNSEKPRLEQLVNWGIIPEYFLTVVNRLEKIFDQGSIEKLPKDLKERIRVAGGTDLYIQIPDKIRDAKLDLLSQYPGLSGVRRDENTIYIGGNTTMEELKRSTLLNEILPEFGRHMGLVASTIIRNRATVAGNIVNASPIGDVTIILIALNAKLILYSKGKNREIFLSDFFLGYKDIDMKKDEVIKEITFPAVIEAGRFHFEKVSKRKILDIASCNSAICCFSNKGIISDVRISAGGVAPIPLYLKETSLYLKDKRISGETIKESLDIAQREISPISDIRGSMEYKSLLLKHLMIGHFVTLFPQQVKPEDLL